MNIEMNETYARDTSTVWEHEIISSASDLKEWIKYEGAKYPKRTLVGGVFPLTENDAIFKYQKRLRKTEYYLNTEKKWMYYLSLVKLNRLRFKYGMKVRLNSCGKGLCIVHLGSIITNGDVGEDARLFVNSAIVSNGGGEREPRLGNHVTLFTNAVVCGDVKIGNNNIIGANSVVTKNFEESNIIIAGTPAKKIKNRLLE